MKREKKTWNTLIYCIWFRRRFVLRCEGGKLRSWRATVLQSLAPTLIKHLPVTFLWSQNTFISLFWCVWLGLELTLQDSGPPGLKFTSPYVVCHVISCMSWNEILLRVKLQEATEVHITLCAHHFGCSFAPMNLASSLFVTQNGESWLGMGAVDSCFLTPYCAKTKTEFLNM